ncbi:MAG: Fe-S cluster assembly protein SufD [Actinobacteria bacterium]|jgi:Fe-S cluster assembly protein SufD|nr:Fe-S cluster assembly protein SufD [Actinomycetota bacterium]
MSLLTTNYLTPTGREEAWRFTPLKRLRGLHDGTAEISLRSSLIVKELLPSGVSFVREELPPLATSDDIIIERIRGNSPEVAHLSISANTELEAPIHLGRLTGALDSAELSRVRISLGAHAVATVVVENTGDTILAEDLEISLAPGSSLTFITLQEFESKSVYAARHHAVIDRDAVFKSVTVTVGGDVVRILPTVEFIAPGGSAELLGVYFATAGQFFEHRMHVDHAVPKAKSRVNFKGALSGRDAHTVWIGDVLIRAVAEGTDTYELNRNLLLSDGARADSVPNLEIETGEIVGAGHASTTGRFDDEQLFYLMSRGIALEDARRLVVRGFFNEIVIEIGIEAIQERLMNRIDFELERAGA